MENDVLKVVDLKTHFFTRRGIVKAVDGVSFSVAKGETVGIVGESGCGKTITGLSILRLVPQPAGRIVGGSILFEGADLLQKSDREMRELRGTSISMILQDPMQSLDPVFTIGDQVGEAVRTHKKAYGRKTVLRMVVEVLTMVGIAAAKVRLRDYPHQLSGGMRQRVVGAIAMSCQPRLLIADEPTTSLDLTIQAQYLRLLKDIQKSAGLSMIFITHDFGIVAKMCNRVFVMYAGKIVEAAMVRELFTHPAHPYTIALMNCLPKLETEVQRLEFIGGHPPALRDLPAGCSFAPRCARSKPVCYEEYPPMATIGEGHQASCWLLGQKG